ncbi:DUF2141 domain-containing protein [Mucilaginibacter flavus]|uniref:DUF2141 domain-containing protein n=1 Tax=Mucilaginibacter flavus TaxID=931504 RepID=UPI0025B45DD2|nr:DUF2141 domain-containing protein [Mucilaginibacter flavus]MDN3583891.1 DUF2141 domain-containing protein [Mucilaginibacter flavus]
MKKKRVLLLVGSLLIFLSSYARAQELELKITGIKSAKGSIIINVFKDEAGYEKEEPYKKFSFNKQALANGSMTLEVSLDPGTYGITLLDDENGNGKIDKNFIGIPKEGFGFSNFFMTKMKKPAFDDFKVDTKTQAKVQIKVKYM